MIYSLWEKPIEALNAQEMVVLTNVLAEYPKEAQDIINDYIKDISAKEGYIKDLSKRKYYFEGIFYILVCALDEFNDEDKVLLMKEFVKVRQEENEILWDIVSNFK